MNLLTDLELAAVRTRLADPEGLYTASGKGGPNYPNLRGQLEAFVTSFLNNPLMASSGGGADNAPAVWAGGGAAIGGSGYAVPVWQWVHAAHAGLYYQLYMASTDAAARARAEQCRDKILAAFALQLTQTGIGTQPAHWNTSVPFENGFFESKMWGRMCYALDCVRDAMPPAQFTAVSTYLTAFATYFTERFHTAAANHFPQRRNNDYTVRGWLAADRPPGALTRWADGPYREAAPVNGGATPVPPDTTPAGADTYLAKYGPWNVYEETFDATRPNNVPASGNDVTKKWQDSGYLFTHVDAQGVRRNRCPNLSQVWNNRRGMNFAFVTQCGAVLGNTTLLSEAARFFREWLMYGVFPDGSIASDADRNHDYGVPQQGFRYEQIIVEAFILCADAHARRGDRSLYEFSTTAGLWGTEVPTGGTAKTLKTVLDAWVPYFDDTSQQYHVKVNPFQRLRALRGGAEGGVDPVTGQPVRREFYPYGFMYAMANKFYRDERYRRLYRQTGEFPAYPRNVGNPNPNDPTEARYAGAGPMWHPYDGSNALYPMWPLVTAEMEAVGDPYGQQRISIALSEVSVRVAATTRATPSAPITAIANGARWLWQMVTGGSSRPRGLNGPVITLSNVASGQTYTATVRVTDPVTGVQRLATVSVSATLTLAT